jgi:membrane-bound lytic murein transglycosylase D
VPAFIAANYVMNYYCDHNICPLNTTLPAKTDTVMIDRNVHFEQIAHVTGVSMDLLRELNPQYRRDIINGNTTLSALRLPQP